MLVEYFPKFWQTPDHRVFVPLCGKSEDLLFFAERGKVVGSELSARACQQFFAENQLAYTRQAKHPFTLYQSKDIDIYQGDFFALQAAQFKPFDWIYDRAALIALPESMRTDYVQHLISFMGQKTRLFLLTLEFDQREMAGPPFAISAGLVHQLFAGFNIRQYAQRELTDKVFAQRILPLSQVRECLYIISR